MEYLMSCSFKSSSTLIFTFAATVTSVLATAFLKLNMYETNVGNHFLGAIFVGTYTI